MSTIRAVAAAKHARTLSQPFRRTFYSPFAALQHSPLTNSPSGSNNSVEAAHEHEREHAARTLYVVSEPNAADFKYGVPAGAYPNAAPYHHPVTTTTAAAAAPNTHQNVSSTSCNSRTSCAHLYCAPAGVGASAAVRFRSAPGEMVHGGESGLGLMHR